MESSVVTTLFLPLALAIIMLGMGLNLEVKDFRLIAQRPKIIVLGLATQFILMPMAAWMIAATAGLSPELSVGLILVAACPIGTIANFMVHIAKGDSAYSLTLTAICSFVSVLTIPLVMNLASLHFMSQTTSVQLPLLSTVLQVFAMIILPVGLGMLLRRYAPGFSSRLDRPLRILSLVFLTILVAGTIAKERNNILDFFLQAGAATFALNCAAILMGFGMGRLFIDAAPVRRALIIGTGMRNSALAIAIASSPTLLNNPTMAIPAAIYTITMFLSVVVMVGWLKYSGRLTQAQTACENAVQS